VSDVPEDREFGLLMPFVVCTSNGGVFDDTAFVAGAQLGELWRQMQDGGPVEPVYVNPHLVPQLDLAAMHFGYHMTVEPWDEHNTLVEFERPPVNGGEPPPFVGMTAAILTRFEEWPTINLDRGDYRHIAEAASAAAYRYVVGRFVPRDRHQAAMESTRRAFDTEQSAHHAALRERDKARVRGDALQEQLDRAVDALLNGGMTAEQVDVVLAAPGEQEVH
jgi:hypothetical protein